MVTLFKNWNDLPPEIRMMILKERLTMPGPILWASKKQAIAEVPFVRAGESSCKEYANGATFTQSRICQLFPVSKTMYAEAIPIYFGTNTFNFKSTEEFVVFFGRLSPRYRWQLGTISMSWIGKSRVAAAKALKTFVALRELKLDQVTLYRFQATKEHVDASGNVVEARINTYGQKDLLNLRGLEKISIDFNDDIVDCGQKRPCTQADKSAFMQDLQVMKSRQDQKMLQKQRAKDFPMS